MTKMVKDGHSISLSLKICNLLSFINCLRIELYLFLFFFMIFLKSIPVTQLFQDKICLQKLNQSGQVCSKLSEINDKDDPKYDYKTLMLAESSQFSMYSYIISLCPCVFWSLLLGSWLDKYYYGKKFLLISSVFTTTLASLLLFVQAICFDMNYQYILLTVLPDGITGAFYSAIISLNAYVSVVTPVRLRALRMAIIEISINFANLAANFLVGFLIDRPALFGNGQLHNYSIIFLISAASGTLGFFWILFTLDERKDKQRFDDYLKMIQLQENIKLKENPSSVEEEKQPIYISNVNPIKLLFNFSNIKDIFVTTFKRRKNKARLQLWLCLISAVVFVISHYGPLVFQYQFNQKVYNWGPAKQSYVATIGNLIYPIILSFGTLIFVKILQVNDMTISMIGIVCYTIQGIIIGTYLTEYGNYLSLFISPFGGLTMVGIKSHLTKIIPREEMGKVFSLVSALEALAPAISATFFTSIFRLTMDSMPGLGYQISSLLLMGAFYSLIWIDLNVRSREKEQKRLQLIEQKFRESESTKL